MTKDTFVTLLQSMLLIPVFMIVVYLGFWLTIIIGPLITGGLTVMLIFWSLKEWKEHVQEQKNQDKENHE